MKRKISTQYDGDLLLTTESYMYNLQIHPSPLEIQWLVVSTRLWLTVYIVHIQHFGIHVELVYTMLIKYIFVVILRC